MAAAFLEKSNSLRRGGLGLNGFRATKREKEKTDRKSPGSVHHRGNVGRGPGLGEMQNAAEQSGGAQFAEAVGLPRREKIQREAGLAILCAKVSGQDSETDTGCAHPSLFYSPGETPPPSHLPPSGQ